MIIKVNDLPYVTTKRPINWGAFLFLTIALSITVYLGTHAYLQHREEAEQARNCVQQNGVWKAYREPDGTRVPMFCRMEMISELSMNYPFWNSSPWRQTCSACW